MTEKHTQLEDNHFTVMAQHGYSYVVSSRIVLIFLLSTSTQAASLVAPQ